jgi:hypothetical protein
LDLNNPRIPHSAVPKTLGIETLDGVDRYAARHLKALEITTVQHMAAANPLILFSTLPYGLSQIMQWIDQALLITCLGGDLYNHLRGYGVTSATALMAASQGEFEGSFTNIDNIDSKELFTAMRVIDQNSQFRRLSNFTNNPQTWIMESLVQFSRNIDNYKSTYTNLPILQRFNSYSPLIIPGSVIVFCGCLLVLWTNLRNATDQLTALILSSAFAETGGGHIIGLPANVRSVIACFLAFGILMTLGVCLYSGFLSRKPSQRAADAVRTILSFSFGIVTGTLSGGA